MAVKSDRDRKFPSAASDPKRCCAFPFWLFRFLGAAKLMDKIVGDIKRTLPKATYPRCDPLFVETVREGIKAICFA